MSKAKKTRIDEQEVKCRCGYVQMSSALVAFRCKKCNGFNYVDAALDRVKDAEKFIEGVHGQLGGYCADCGMMKFKGEKPCVKCGGSETTNTAPRPAGNIVAVSLLGHKPHMVGNLFQ